MDRRPPTTLRALWLALGAVGMWALPATLHAHSGVVATVLAIQAGAVWAVGWVSMLVPRMVTLTIVRIVAPLAVVGATINLALSGAHIGTLGLVAVSLLALGALVLPVTVDRFVDGSSYGPERRFALRTPLMSGMVAIPLTWVLSTCVFVVGPLLAVGQWVGGAIVAALWAASVRWALRSFHLPAQRWVVFVPAGLVISDPLILVDALLLPRRNVVELGPAYADSNATDLTPGTLGLALQVDLTEPFAVPIRDGRKGKERTIETDRLVFSVLRPGALLAEAANRRVKIGETSATPIPRPASDDSGISQSAVPLPTTRSSK